MRKSTRLSAGNEHLLEGVGGRTRSANGHKLPDIGEQYTDTVSIAAGDITKASAARLMRALGMDDASRFLDIGSSTGCLCMHVALATSAVRVTGIEVLKPRSELAQQLYRDVIAQSSSMAFVLGRRVQHVTGDIMGNLSLLFEHTHVFMFDKCFASVTRAVLAHAVSYLSDDGGGAVRTIASCWDLREHNLDLQRVGEPISLALTGGTESFQSYVFSVDQKRKNTHAVEVFRSPVHGLGLRTTRAVMEGTAALCGDRRRHGVRCPACQEAREQEDAVSVLAACRHRQILRTPRGERGSIPQQLDGHGTLTQRVPFAWHAQ